MLREHLRRLSEWPRALQERMLLIVCDDCSKDYPADAELINSQPFEARLYRITRKAAWNYRAAKNIAMHEAPEGWALVTDIDHVLRANEAVKLFDTPIDHRRVYAFNRIDAAGQAIRAVYALRLMTKAMYWRIGGYDESFVGTHKGLRGELTARISAAAGPMKMLPVRLMRYMRRDVGDQPDNLVRDDAENRKKVELICARWTELKTMTFPYERLL